MRLFNVSLVLLFFKSHPQKIEIINPCNISGLAFFDVVRMDWKNKKILKSLICLEKLKHKLLTRSKFEFLVTENSLFLSSTLVFSQETDHLKYINWRRNSTRDMWLKKCYPLTDRGVLCTRTTPTAETTLNQSLHNISWHLCYFLSLPVHLGS